MKILLIRAFNYPSSAREWCEDSASIRTFLDCLSRLIQRFRRQIFLNLTLVSILLIIFGSRGSLDHSASDDDGLLAWCHAKSLQSNFLRLFGLFDSSQASSTVGDHVRSPGTERFASFYALSDYLQTYIHIYIQLKFTLFTSSTAPLLPSQLQLARSFLVQFLYFLI